MYNIQLRCIQITTAALEEQSVLKIMSVCPHSCFSYLAHNTHLSSLHYLSSVAHLVLPHFSTLSNKWYNFWENIFEYKMRVLIFSTTFV